MQFEGIKITLAFCVTLTNSLNALNNTNFIEVKIAWLCLMDTTFKLCKLHCMDIFWVTKVCCYVDDIDERQKGE